MIQGTVAILNAAGLPKKFKPKAMTIVPPTPSRPAPSEPAQDLEEGEIYASDASDGSDERGNDSSPTSGSDSESAASNAGDHTPSATTRRSARIAQRSGVGQQLLAPPTSPAPTHFSLEMAGGFPILLTSCSTTTNSIVSS